MTEKKYFLFIVFYCWNLFSNWIVEKISTLIWNVEVIYFRYLFLFNTKVLMRYCVHAGNIKTTGASENTSIYFSSKTRGCQFASSHLKVIRSDFIETTQCITVIAKRIKPKWRYLPSALSFQGPKTHWPSPKSSSRRDCGAPVFCFMDANWRTLIAL